MSKIKKTTNAKSWHPLGKHEPLPVANGLVEHTTTLTLSYKVKCAFTCDPMITAYVFTREK